MANWRAIAMAMRKPDFTHLPVTIRRWKGLRMEKIEIHRDQITVTERGLFGKTKWTESVSAFRGLLRRTDLAIGVGGGVMAPTASEYTNHLLELVHPEKEKTVLLFVTTKEEIIRKMWKDAAHSLDLPDLEPEPDNAE